ncbi:RrF2 family transcriptional regulator [Thermomonospora catenispora]|uniref:RrF2 family transcriptional regulator n=1 Tax=Thermomonospora catenispora TaxID=2493090 RepID=UPI00111CAA5D|nr:Rrf2 family transcriptional regulator [Thermomonospora catenispora]TNY35302.1 Rrf2 family transcriptional regulator [Thermomonospora catenispora]
MRLTRFTDLALRIAMRLAVADPAEIHTTRQVAEAVNAPYTHVAKVVSRLSELGVVEARRGRGGGLVLTERGRDFSIGALMRELEGSGDVAGCDDAPPCPLRAICRLRKALREAQEAFYAALDPVTVRDLVDRSNEPLEQSGGPVLIQLTDRPS